MCAACGDTGYVRVYLGASNGSFTAQSPEPNALLPCRCNMDWLGNPIRSAVKTWLTQEKDPTP